MNIFSEIYQFLFISSIIFIVYVIFDVAVKMYGRFAQKNPEIKYVPSTSKKILLWISISLILNYLIV